jgi:glycosyltransferase involved in cell wall biosynthesis
MGTTSLGHTPIHTIAMLGNHLPRQCGIATFTTDLMTAIEHEVSALDSIVVAMNDAGAHHAYPERVRFEVPQGDIEAYRKAAVFLNVKAADVLSVQHEYGIFGGPAGAHVLELLRAVRMPIVTTLHTILAAPDPQQRAVLEALVSLSERVVVMSADGAELLQSVHGVDPQKIDVIPHGIPVVPARHSKAVLGAEDRHVILTFGLLSPDKGIEHVIDAMPAILNRHPNTDYIVLGATHPHVKQQRGEAYRLMLQARAERLGVETNVLFHNRFVSHDELVEFLGAADLYITPYLNEAQSTSGTLAYAVGSGKAVISTPYRYARELLAEGRGILVPWKDSAAIAREVNGLLDAPAQRAELQQRASTFGRTMGWPVVARRYLNTFERARISHAERLSAGRSARTRARRQTELPHVTLSHVRLMTDDTGILQHALFDIPRLKDGYCVDDNARALLLLTLVEEAGTEAPELIRTLATRYLAFVCHAYDETTGRFRNFLSWSRAWRDELGSDDSLGRSLWALGTVVGRSADPGRRDASASLFQSALAAVPTVSSPRAVAYVLLGIDQHSRAFPNDTRVSSLRDTLATRLLEGFRDFSRQDWPWFEDRLTYCNARLPQGLLVAATRRGDADMVSVALRSLDWLVDEHVAPDGTFAPVGTNGFHERGGARAGFDQQPVEACAMVSACLEAHRVTGAVRWLEHARWAFHWFLGNNARQAQIYDARTGGCRDGLHADRLNENQGAESTLSFLMALSELRAADRMTVSALPIAESAKVPVHLPHAVAGVQAVTS